MFAPWTAPDIGDGYDQRKNYLLFLWWSRRTAQPVDIEAVLLGTSARTLYRWHQLRRVPRQSAVLLEQIVQGPRLVHGAWRGQNAWRLAADKNRLSETTAKTVYASLPAYGQQQGAVHGNWLIRAGGAGNRSYVDGLTETAATGRCKSSS